MNRLVYFSRRWLTMAALVLVSTLGLSLAIYSPANAASYPTYTYKTEGKFVISGGKLSEFLTSGSFEASWDSSGNRWEAHPTVKSGSSCDDNNKAHIQIIANNVTEPGVESIVSEVLVLCDNGDTLELDSTHYGDMAEYWTDGSQKVIKESSTPPGQPGPVKPPGIEGSELYRFYHEKDATGKYILACVGMFKQFSGIGAPGTELEGCAEFTDNDQSFTWSRTLNVNNPALYACGGAGEKPYKFTITVPNPPTINDVGSVPGTITVEPASSTSNCTDLNLKSARDGMPIEIMAGDQLDSLLGVEFDDADPESLCQVTGGLSWILCPIMNTVADINDSAYRVIQTFLEIPPMMTTGGNNGAFRVWEMIRNIANVLFAVAFIFIVYSQLTSVGISNYGIKKMLPKMLIGVILVNTSFWIVALSVDLSNVVGRSIYQVMDQFATLVPGDSVDFGEWGWRDITAAILAGGTVAGVAIGATVTVMLAFATLLPLAVSALFMIVGLMFVLTFRHAMVFILAVIAPLAFVAYLLPNTEGLFKSWFKMLRILLYIYPAVAFIMGASSVAAAVLFATAQDMDDDLSKVIMMLIAVAMPAMAIFAALMLAKTMGSVMGKLGIKNPFGGAIDAAKSRAKAFGQRQDDINATAGITGKGNPFRRAIGVAGGARRRARNDSRINAATRNKTLASQSYIADTVGKDGGGASLLHKATGGKLGNDLAGQLSVGTGDAGRLRVAAEAKSAASKETMQNIDNIMNTTDYKDASSPTRLKQLFNSAETSEERVAYARLMGRNGSPGVKALRETLTDYTNGRSPEDGEVLEMKELLSSDDGFKRLGRDFEVWSQNEHSVNGNPHANFEAVTEDLGTWKDISAKRYASMSPASQKEMHKQLDKPGNETAKRLFAERISSDEESMGNLKTESQEWIRKALKSTSAGSSTGTAPLGTTPATPETGPSSSIQSTPQQQPAKSTEPGTLKIERIEPTFTNPPVDKVIKQVESTPTPKSPNQPVTPIDTPTQQNTPPATPSQNSPSNTQTTNTPSTAPRGGSVDSTGAWTPSSANENYHDGMQK